MHYTAAPIRPKVDRRKHPRFPLPTCATCENAATTIILRTERMTYIQCRRCHQVRSIPNPPRATLTLELL
jgi:hypothetical protein